jgi:hypothetical protein
MPPQAMNRIQQSKTRRRSRMKGNTNLIGGTTPNYHNTHNDSSSEEMDHDHAIQQERKISILSSSSSSSSSSQNVSSNNSSSEESDGGWSSSNNDLSSSHLDDESVVETTRAHIPSSNSGISKNICTEDMVEDGLILLSDDENAIELVDDEFMSDTILRVNNGSNSSFTSLRHQQQVSLNRSYDFDGTHLEEFDNDKFNSEINVPSSVAIIEDSQQVSQYFDASDPSMDDSISKNYDSRYDGSLKDLMQGIGQLSNEDLQHNEHCKEHDTDDDHDSDDSSDMDEMNGYLSTGDLRCPNILLQPYVGERPPTPPSPVRMMSSISRTKYQNSTLKSNATVSPLNLSPTNGTNSVKTIPIPMVNLTDDDNVHDNGGTNNVSRIVNDDIENKSSFDPEQRFPESAIHSNYRNDSDDKLNQHEYNDNHDEQLASSIDARGQIELHGDNYNNTGVQLLKEQDMKHRRTIKLLVISLLCALIALLALGGGVVVLLLSRNDETSPKVSIPQQQTTVVKTNFPTISPTPVPVPTKRLVSTTNPPVFTISTTTPTLPPKSAFPVSSVVTDQPVLRNSTATLYNTPYLSPTMNTGNVPTPSVVDTKSPITGTNSPTIASIKIPPI